MFNKSRIHFLALLLLSLLIFNFSSQVSASPDAANFSVASIGEGSTTYHDTRFDFSLTYPEDWFVMERNDSDPNATSGVVKFTPINPAEASADNHGDDSKHTDHSDDPYIAIGLYLAEFTGERTLDEWSTLYQYASTPFEHGEIQVENPVPIQLGNYEAIKVVGSSPLTDFQVVNIVHGQTVWFMWTNIGLLPDSPYLYEYIQLISSFEFGEETPSRLSEIYGEEFVPVNLQSASTNTKSVDQNSMTTSLGRVEQYRSFSSSLPSSWKAPVIGNYNVQCGSAAHTGSAEYAADVATPMNTTIYAAYSGNVTFAGWDSSGYGNLIKTSSIDGKISYYAHLNTINTYYGANIVTEQFIAKSGDSGPSSVHLHFHVRYTDLTGMTGFTPEPVYPTMQNVDCGQMGR